MRLIFFGMLGQFSLITLDTLLGAKVEIEAVVIPANPATPHQPPRQLFPVPTSNSDVDLPLVDPYHECNIIHTAWAHHIPVWEINSLSDSQTQQHLIDMQPDLIVVACFPYLIPPAILQLPRYGCLNLHPSLLPAYRGPEPLFWLAYYDERLTGVTLHFLDTNLDSGDIVAQTTFKRPDGLSGQELDHRSAEAGAALLLTALQKLQHGPLPRQPQIEAKASYFPLPTEADLIVTTDWSAQRAYNFICGAEGWPLFIVVDDTQYYIRVAKSFSTDQTLEKPYILLGDELWVQCQPGVLWVKVFRA